MTVFKGEAQVLDSDDAKYSTANSEFLIKKYAAFYNNLIKSLRNPVGSIKKSSLSVADFQTENGTNWVLCDGQDITGSDLATITGVTTAPDMVTLFHYISQTPNDINLQDLSFYNVQDHFHYLHRQEVGGSPTNSASGPSAVNRTLYGEVTNASESLWRGNSTTPPTLARTQPMTANPSRPNTCKVNFFIRINND